MRKFVAWYGGYVSSAPLRYAIVSYAASLLSDAFEQQRIDNALRASHELRKQTADTIDDSHLLAVHLLKYKKGTGLNEEIFHSEGTVAILDILGSRSKNEVVATINLALFRPYFLEMITPASFAFSRCTESRELVRALNVSLSTPFPTWSSRLQSQSQLYDISLENSPSTIVQWQLSWDFQDIMELIGISQQGGKFDEDQQWTLPWNNYLAKWNDDIGSAECQKLLSISEDAVATSEQIRDKDEYLLNACILCLSLKLLVFALEDRFRITEALRSPHAISWFRTLISFIRLHHEDLARLMRPDFKLKIVFIGGLALSPTVSHESSP